jgi:phosphomannomutase
MGVGVDVIDLGLSTTPTVEMAVALEKADGGIVLTASHNPKQWNALKLLNHKGEFISGKDGEEVLAIADNDNIEYSEVNNLGKYFLMDGYMAKHIEKILALPAVNVEAIKNKNFKIVIDCVNSTGGIAVPMLLKALGVSDVVELYCTPDGNFPHNPEPLKEHLGDICKLVVEEKADFGIVVDPDVDRLAFISNDGDIDLVYCGNANDFKIKRLLYTSSNPLVHMNFNLDEYGFAIKWPFTTDVLIPI